MILSSIPVSSGLVKAANTDFLQSLGPLKENCKIFRNIQESWEGSVLQNQLAFIGRITYFAVIGRAEEQCPVVQ